MWITKVKNANDKMRMSRESFRLWNHLDMSKWLRQSPQQICSCCSNGIWIV